MAVITLMSDFGTRDHYVACMKGVILQTAPKATIVDVTHDIMPHGIVQAAFVLRQVWAWFPPNTIHVAVVDPGVGTSRQTLVAYDGTSPVYATLVSTGLPESEETVTPTGKFHIHFKHLSDDMQGTVGDDESYSVEDVPWVQYLHRNIAYEGPSDMALSGSG